MHELKFAKEEVYKNLKKNKDQTKAIETVAGPVIVISGPGSGKTTTMLARINYMVSHEKINEENILMVTFTNAAAKEMKKRYSDKYGESKVTFCTIHSLCLNILKNFQNFAVSDLLLPQDQKNFFYNCLSKNHTINDKNEFINSILTDISVMKNNQLDIKEMKITCCKDKKLFESLYHEYENFKTENKRIDFDDMLLLAYQEMLNSSECLNMLQKKYQYIICDEYQDTNYLQRDILYLLAGESQNLCVVGDDDQSIYGFRGARPEIMLNFEKDFPNSTVINMGTNYRSLKNIVNCSDSLIKNNTARFPKTLTASRRDSGDIYYKTYPTRDLELLAVTQEIRQLIKNGVEPNNIAVLYRTNKQAEMIASEFMSNKIPFVTTEPIKSKYDHWVFQDISAYRNLATGNGGRRELSRILNHPQRYLSMRYAAKGYDETYMKELVHKLNTEDWKLKKDSYELNKMFSLIKIFAQKNPLETLRFFYSFTEYEKYLKDYSEFTNENYSDIEMLWNGYLADIKKTGDDWGEWAKYVCKYKKALESKKNSTDGVTLSTMHRAKGLEWDYVFIIDCVDGITPHVKSEDFASLEEERRLFYVAATRAKDKLMICSYKKDGKKSIDPSPYIKEMQKGGKCNG